MDLNQEILKEGKTIVKFYADWCMPCKMMSSVLDEVSKTDGTKIVNVDTEQYSDLASEYGVTNLPTMRFYNDGELIGIGTGAMPAANIRKVFSGELVLPTE